MDPAVSVDGDQGDGVEGTHAALGKRLAGQARLLLEAQGLHAHFGQAVDEAGKAFRRVGDAAHHAVVLAAHVVGHGLDVLPRHEIGGEHLAEDLDGGLEFLGDDVVGAEAVQRADLGHEARAGDDDDLGVGLAGLGHDGPDGRQIRDDDGYHPGLGDAEGVEYGGLAGVAVGDGLALAVAGDGFGVHLEYGVGQAALLGGSRKVLAREAEAHDDDVV